MGMKVRCRIDTAYLKRNGYSASQVLTYKTRYDELDARLLDEPLPCRNVVWKNMNPNDKSLPESITIRFEQKSQFVTRRADRRRLDARIERSVRESIRCQQS